MFGTNRVFLTALIVMHEPFFGVSCRTDSCSVSVRIADPWHNESFKTLEVSNSTEGNCFKHLFLAGFKTHDQFY